MDVSVFSQVLVLLFLMALGFLSFKLKITTKEASEYFSSFAMKITLPCMIITSFRRPFSMELLGEAGATMVMSCTVFGIYLLICWIYPRLLKIKGPERGVHRYAILISNSGFVGYPVVEAIMGPSYLFHAVIFNMPGCFMAFSVGAWFVAKESGKAPALSWKLILTPPFVATIVGFFMFLFSLPLPASLEKGIKMAADITIPLSMMVIGISLAQANIRQMLGSWRIYVTVFVRLLLLPALIGFICYFAGFNRYIMILAVILTATPAGSTTSILASVYNVATEEAGSIVALSTMLCALTIPLVVIVLFQLIG
jgi:hypothetical protein